MTIAEPMVLPADVELTPVDELPEEIRAQFAYRAGDHAVTRPLARSTSSIVDANTARLLGSFRTPARIVDAVLAFASEAQLDPRETLERSYPVLKDLLASGFLVPAESDLAAPIQASVIPDGALIGGFRVVRLVQVMIDTQLCLGVDGAGTHVALKIARPDSDGGQAFAHEASILRGLDGTVTPRVIDVGHDEGRPYLALSWVIGSDAEAAATELRALPASEGRPRLLALVDAILAAYGRLHGQGVLHGDVHPNNVLVGPDGAVTLIDFGLAARSNDRGVPRGGVDFFMEPESAAAQVAGSGASVLTAAGEQYGVAAMTYRLLTGAYTHTFSLEPDEMRRQLLEDSPLPFDRHGVDGLPRVEAVLVRALRKAAPDRFASVDAFLAAYRDAVVDDLTDPAPSRPGRHRAESDQRIVDGFLADVLDRLAADGALIRSALVPPVASINLGAAGIAAGILHVAMARDDTRLLALADLWSMKALQSLGTDAAFVNEELEITPAEFGTTGIHHSPTGVYLADALIAHARADQMMRSAAIDGFVSIAAHPGPERDISFGQSGILLGSAMLVDVLPDDDPARATLVELGNTVSEHLWDELSSMPELGSGDPRDDQVRYLGAAHGWTGFLYALLRWAEATDVAPPPLESRLAEIEAMAVPVGCGLVWPREAGPPDDASLASTWCNGAAGMVPMWSTASRLLGDDRFLEVAERAAWTAYQGQPAPGDLCCGLAGRAYALLHMARVSGEPIWRARARALGVQAVASVRENALRRDSLYKGAIGVAALLADLDRPDDAAMPFYDRVPWRSSSPADRLT